MSGYEIPEVDADIPILPLIFLVDVSSSMRAPVDNGASRIQIVNENLRKVFAELGRLSSNRLEYDVAIVTFGTDARYALQLCAAEQAVWQDLTANGTTNLARGLDMVKELIEDRNQFPQSAGRPTVVLVSDGAPYPENQGWQESLRNFCNTGRSAKCDRFALGIGPDTNMDVLKLFINEDQDIDARLNHAQNATDIITFFRKISTHTQMKAKVAPTAPAAPAGISQPKTTVTGGQTRIQKPAAAPKKNPFM